MLSESTKRILQRMDRMGFAGAGEALAEIERLNEAVLSANTEAEDCLEVGDMMKAQTERLRHELANAHAEIKRLRELLFAKGAMNDPPCFVCGYNGPGYYQPDVHPCAAEHNKRT